MASDAPVTAMRTQAKATVFGGRGFIGRNLVARLRATGWNCSLAERDDGNDAWSHMGHVFYCAGLTADYARRPFDTIEAHVSLLAKVLREGAFESLVYLSSTRLYDSQPGKRAVEDEALLFDPANPRHIYDLSKALGESLCRVAGEGKARVARLSCVYLDHTDEDGFLPGLLRQVIELNGAQDRAVRMLSLDTSRHFSRDYVGMDDVLDALVLIATRGKDFIYNVASGENTSNGALFDRISSITRLDMVAQRTGDGDDSPTICIDKMRNEFGWAPTGVLERVGRLLGRDVDAGTD